jgi:two-component system sensor histidine kinase KdpD
VALEPAFVSRLTHDLRVPFAAVRSALYLLERHGTQLDGVKEKKWIEAASSSLNSFERLLKGVDLYLHALTWVPTSNATCNLQEVVQAEIAAVQDQRHGFTMPLNWDNKVPPTQPIDGPLIALALRQLFDNAAKHSPAGHPPEVRLAATSSGWELAVINDGPAIPSHEEAQLFRPFFHSQSHRTDPGPGLGLAIARSAAEKTGCRLSHSRRAERTWFSLQFESLIRSS